MSGAGFLDGTSDSSINFDEIGFAHFDWHVLAVMAARMGTAALIAALVAYRWWRPFLPGHFERTESGAQVLISVSGAMMVQVVGTNTALAFALVGLGGFIRFRSGIKDPREAGVMFLMIGIGMAAGIGNMPVALVAAMFGIPLLIVLDYGETRRRSLARWRCSRPSLTACACAAGRPAAFCASRFFGSCISALLGWSSASAGRAWSRSWHSHRHQRPCMGSP